MFTDIIDTVLFNTAKTLAESCYMTADVLRDTATMLDKQGDKLMIKADEMNVSPAPIINK
jgi:hypothetical protein